MKRLWEISPQNIAIGLSTWLVVTNILVGIAHQNDWWLPKVLLFLSITLLPGIAVLRVLGIGFKNNTTAVLYSFGVSLLVLMLGGLATNQIVHMFTPRPLQTWGILGLWDIITATIIVLSARKNRSSLRVHFSVRVPPKTGLLLVGLSLFLPLGATLGAFQLNNGGKPVIAELTLCFAAALIVFTLTMRRRLLDGTLAWFVFITGLTILLMTSLRGWDITGHDIEREFRVYTLTHIHAHWDIGLDRSPYNACLSITILPEVFAKLLNISGLVVFKVILQLVFAACPVAIFILLRQYASKLAALGGTILFICYPTFINDSAMLTRQGVAYVFFALALLIVSNKVQKRRYKGLFLLCALGAVLSHYSTAYMFVALFAVAVGCKYGIAWLQTWRGKNMQAIRKSTVLSPLFVVFLLLFTFLWYTQITATSAGLVTTVHDSIANIPKFFSSDSRSSDTSGALLFSNIRSQAELYQSYEVSSQSKHLAPVLDASQFFPNLASSNLPLTRLGEIAQSKGIKSSFITTLRQNFARILQGLALLSVLYAAYQFLQKRPHALDFDFICLSIAGLVLLALMVIMPVLSVNYGILRAFQQMLIFLILPITILLARLTKRLFDGAKTAIAAIGMATLFLLFTGLFAQILGGTSPTLSMNNSGIYYGIYNSSAADAQSFVWLKNNVPNTVDVRAANFSRASMHDPNYPFFKPGILPSQINADSFVYVDPAQVKAKKLYTYYQSSALTLTFPLAYYDLTKNEIYSTASTGVYR